MMRHAVILIYIIGTSLNAFTQFSRQVIQLKDKAFNTFSISNPSQYLSSKAIQRRQRFGIAIDSSDLPITQRYLDSIKSLPGVQILSVSRWLNRVLIKINDPSAVDKINEFSFVEGTAPVALRAQQLQGPTDKFSELVITGDPIANRVMQMETDTLSYGTSYDQIHIHEGEYLHNKNFMGEGITIAVLDAGFNSYKTITAFDSVRLQGRILGEKDFVAFDNSVNEDHFHGMQCLSILCANWPGQMVGSAPKASYWLIRTEDAASEYPIEEFNWVVGAEFADSVGADIISSSLGYSQFDNPQFNHTYAQLNGKTTAATIGAATAAKKGMVVTNSAGNEGNKSWQYILAPADADSVLAVGAIDAFGNIASFSSRGIPSDPRIKPNVVSVGVGTVVAGFNNQPAFGNGTSFSNPNLNGLIACLWQAFPMLNNKKILDAVQQSADRYATPNKTYGYGIPNFRKAYHILKKEQNDQTFGVNWLKANPNPFEDTIHVDFIGQIDGMALIQLIDPGGNIIKEEKITVQDQDVYHIDFINLKYFSPGVYIVKYVDANNQRSVKLSKNTGYNFSNDWMIIYPVPYKSNFTVAIKSPVKGTATLRLIDNKGAVIETYSHQVDLDEVYSVQFKSAITLSNGQYYIQYNDGVNKRVRKINKVN